MLTEREKTPWYVVLIMEMLAPFSLLLWAGAALSFLVYFLEGLDGGHQNISNVLPNLSAHFSLTGFCVDLPRCHTSRSCDDLRYRFFLPKGEVGVDYGEFQEFPATGLSDYA